MPAQRCGPRVQPAGCSREVSRAPTREALPLRSVPAAPSP